MMAVEPWTRGHQGGSLDPPQWEKLGSQGNGLGRSLKPPLGCPLAVPIGDLAH